MMKLKRIISTLTAMAIMAATPATAAAATPVPEKAARFFAQHEWASAIAMYGLIISESPADTEAYARAIVAAGMLDSAPQQLDFTSRAIAVAIPFDSLFAQVEHTSLSLGQTSLYRDYLLRVKQSYPWMERHINAQLLRYFTFRRDAPGMIAYSRAMLEGMPANTDFMYPLAQGLLANGQPGEAMAVYENILSIEPCSLEALLYLGNYYADRAKSDPAAREIARGYLLRASQLRDTPYLRSILDRL